MGLEIKNKSFLNEIKDNSIVITDNKKVISLKQKLIDKNILVDTFEDFLRKYQNKELVNKQKSIIFMYKAYSVVSFNLSVYDNLKDSDFILNLVDTYFFYKENKLIKNKKIDDLDRIYNEYEQLLKDNDLITIYDMYQNFDVIKEIEYDNVYFEDVNKLNAYQLNFINKLSLKKNVYVYINDINNLCLLKDLGYKYKKGNLDVHKLFEFESKNLFKDINIVSCNDLYEEIKFISNDIKKNINDGLKFKDILIVSNDVKRYENYFELLFDFPYHKVIYNNLTINVIMSLKKIINGDFTCKTFISFLKLGVFNIDDALVNTLDNYVYLNALEKEPFYKPFKYDFNDALYGYDQKMIDDLNNIKEEVFYPLKELAENVLDEKNSKEILRYLFIYLDEENITGYLNKNDEEGYDALVNVFEYINDYFTDLSIDNVIDLMSILISNLKDDIVMNDEVNIKTLDEYFNDDYKKVYFIGVTEKDIPINFSFKTLINENDLKKDYVYNLIKRHNDYYNNIISNVLLNKNVTITYHRLSDEPSKVSASPLLNRFYNKPISYIYELNKSEIKDFDIKIDKDISSKLFGSNMNLSPSSIELYSKCPYSYFLKYGLGIKKIERKSFDSKKIGTYVHFILENLLKNNVSKDDAIVKIDDYTNNFFENQSLSNAENYVVYNLKQSCKMVYCVIKDELSNAKFNFEKAEFNIKDINYKIKLKNGNLTLKGIVDRIDGYKKDDNYYFRIIDYKTGPKKFYLSDVLNGLNMQMLIYLIAIENIKVKDINVIPTGIFYYPALIHLKKEEFKTDSKKVIKNIKDSIKMNGIILKDSLKLYGEESISSFIDVKSKGNYKEDKVLTEDEFTIIKNKVIKVLKQKANNILQGNFNISPILNKTTDSCMYCPYNSICKFDKEKSVIRTYEIESKKEVIKKIEGEENGLDS